MKLFSAISRNILFSVLLLLGTYNSFATHLVGLDLKYTHVTGNTYKVTLIAYGNCGSGGAGTAYSLLPSATPNVYVYNAGTLVATLTLAIEAPSTGVEITPVCPADSNLTQCTNVAFTIPGIKKFTYSTTYTLPSTSQYWRFLFTGNLGAGGGSAGRAAAITNIGGGTITQLVDTLNNLTAPNSSPNLTIVPTPFFCLNNSDNYNPGAVDPDGDSLTFFLVSGMNGSTTSTAGGPVTYVVPFTPTAPLAVTTMTFNSSTGQISFFPNALQRSLVVYNVEEHRGATLVGTSQREMTFLVLTCTNTPATGAFTGATNGVIADSTDFHICQNTGAFSININPGEPDTLNHITVTTSGLPSGSTFTTTSNGTPHPHCTFTWTSTGVAAGTYTFFVTYTDNNCPLAGMQTLAYNITIAPQPSTTDTLSLINCDGKALVTIIPTGSPSPWTITIKNSGGVVVQTYPGATGVVTDSLGAGTYTTTITSALGCLSTATFTVGTVVQPTITYTQLSPVTCIAKAAISIIPGGLAPWVIKVSNAIGDTIQTFTGVSATFTDSLAPGTYTITIFNAMGCNASIIFTVADPPNMVPTATFTNPSYCGASDGTITLHHLWPGTIDTIKFSFNGVIQPSQVFTVLPDSTVTITGLLAGLYTGITATYGNCISTDAGPVTLTNPPFTMRAISFTNPSWCGWCDGTITLYGLHPGQTDTLNYTLGGIAQPAVVVTIAADSMIVLTGLCQGTYANFIAKTAGVCVSNTLGPVTLTPPPFTMRTLSSVNPSYCGLCDGSITIYGLHPGDLDTIKYTFNGVLQASIIHTIAADSMVVLTGLCAGTYANFVATKAGGCVSNTLGPITLTVPPFTVRALSTVNPSYCGICDGSITIYGLHPGQLDTINYTFNGVAQPPVVALIPLDSTVTITGLCQGVYANFIAHTAGICVSNTLGPVTLTVPPFTISYLTYTNITKCGFCDGIIKVHGAHPGQTDSLFYTKNGVQQPPVVYTVGPDSVITVPGLCAGLYDSFIVHASGVCVSNMLGPITLTDPPIVAAFNYSLHYGCQGDTIFCNNLSSPASDLTYRWYFGDGGTDISTDPTHVYLASGTFVIRLIITNSHCFDSTNKTITLDNLITGGFNTVPDSFVCQDSLVKYISLSTGSGLNYVWSFGDGSTSTLVNPTHSYLNTGRYKILMAVSNFVPCYDTTTKYITVDSISEISVTATDSVICRQGSITFTGNYTSMGNVGVSWVLSNGNVVTGQNPMVYSFDSTGSYTVNLESFYRACPNVKASKSILVFPNPQIDLGPDTSICPGSNPILLWDRNYSNAYPTKWRWSTGQTTPSISIGEPGVYVVIATVNGCSTTDSIVVKNDCYMNIPNVFTPNGDGVNDYFYPRQYLTSGLTYFSMSIYNRWGQEIFQTNTLDGRGWDGKFNDVQQPEGVYIYVIDAAFKDGQKEHHQGNITLLR